MINCLIIFIKLFLLDINFEIENDDLQVCSFFEIYERIELETISDNHDIDDKNEECFDYIKI